MAGGGKRRRIEPSFDAPNEDEDEMRADPGDRRPRGGRRGGKRSRARRGGFLGFMRRAVYWSFILAIWCGIGVGGIVVYYGSQLPSATTWKVPARPPNVKIVSADGRLIANRGATGGEALTLDQMSPYIPKAVIAIEDRRFYSHFGVDPIGLARAFVTNLVSHSVVEGGSTLTQQLAKNIFLSPERTIERKVQEVLLALWLEHKFTKDQILDMYLNRMYFGSGAYGVEAASRRYFNKPARDVTLAQAALLAGLLQAPSRLSPARNPKGAEARAKVVLAAMHDQGMITDKQYARAESQPAKRAPAYWEGAQQYVADRVMQELPSLVGGIKGDVVVTTTVDLNLEKVAGTAIAKAIEADGEKRNVSQGALVSIDGSGAIRALVGGADYAESQYDRATDAMRQPGSAFKPFVYLTALEQGRTPDSVRNDAPVKIGNWTPDNFESEYFGPVTLTLALAKSLNSIAAQLAMEVGPQNVVDTAHRLGIQSKLEANASIALGTSEVTPLELAAAYVPFANGGYKPAIHLIEQVTTGDAKVLYSYRQESAPRVIKPEILGEMNYMMSHVISEGTGRSAYFGWPAGGKTGTSQNYRDAWFVGYTSNLTTAVWFGNDDGSPTRRVTGGSLPAAAWKTFMTAAHRGLTVKRLPGTYAVPPGRASDLMAGEPPRPRGEIGDGWSAAANGPETTGATHPVPEASVGPAPQAGRRHPTTLFDLILGRAD